MLQIIVIQYWIWVPNEENRSNFKKHLAGLYTYLYNLLHYRIWSTLPKEVWSTLPIGGRVVETPDSPWAGVAIK